MPPFNGCHVQFSVFLLLYPIMMILKKMALLPVLLAAGILLAALYGALHDQVSYAISAEYYTLFKFKQFHIAADLPPRIGAAVVGILATWWMGLVIGIPLSLCGLIHVKWQTMLEATLKAYGVALVVAFIAGASGIIYGIFGQPPPADRIAANFEIAGWMHNFSYLGGVLGILLGIGYQIYRRVRMHRKTGDDSPGSGPEKAQTGGFK
jgi:hypothetical protein